MKFHRFPYYWRLGCGLSGSGRVGMQPREFASLVSDVAGAWRRGCTKRGEHAREARCRGLPGERTQAGSRAGGAPWVPAPPLAPPPGPAPRAPRDAPRPAWREVTEPLGGEVTRVACGPGAVWGGLGQDGRIHRSVRGGSVGPGERLGLGRRPGKGQGRVSFLRDGGASCLRRERHEWGGVGF